MGDKDEDELLKVKERKVKKQKTEGDGEGEKQPEEEPYKNRTMYPLKRLFNGKRFKDLTGKELRKLNKKRKGISVKEWKRETYMSKKKIRNTQARKEFGSKNEDKTGWFRQIADTPQ